MLKKDEIKRKDLISLKYYELTDINNKKYIIKSNIEENELLDYMNFRFATNEELYDKNDYFSNRNKIISVKLAEKQEEDI
jgi:hypothetical protein